MEMEDNNWTELQKKREELPEYHTTRIPGHPDIPIEGMMQGRLLRKLEDGSYVVVGYQVWGGGWLSHYGVDGSRYFVTSSRAEAGQSLVHDRFDRHAYTDVDHNVMLFERDRVSYVNHEMETVNGIIVFNTGAFVIDRGGMLDNINSLNYVSQKSLKVTGIVGVNPPEEEKPVEIDCEHTCEAALNVLLTHVQEMDEFINKLIKQDKGETDEERQTIQGKGAENRTVYSDKKA
jgi:hypothetical protein